MYCPECGHRQSSREPKCSACGCVLPDLSPPPQPSFAEEAGFLIPVGVEPYSVAAGYLGLLGFFCLGFLGPVAVFLGVRGLKALQDNPKLRGKLRAWTGIVLGIVQTVALLVWVIAWMMS